jgi:Ser/Thr protein kinase RdoA (MazF antagonist)
MNQVPQETLVALASQFTNVVDELKFFAGGREESDGVVYSYPYQNRLRLLKILSFPLEDESNSLFVFNERLKFANYLGTNGARLAFPEPSPRGNLYESIKSTSQLYVGYTMEVASGKRINSERWDTDLYRRWGELIGKNHRLARQYSSWLESTNPVTGKSTLTWQEEWEVFHGWIREEDVRQKWEKLYQELNDCPINRDTFGFIHNDPHIWNLIDDGKNITLLDFDVANHHWYLNDVAIACQSILFDHSGGLNRPMSDLHKLEDFLVAFRKGYLEEYLFPQDWVEKLNILIAYRRILLYTVMYGWISSNKYRRDTWKKMILTQPNVCDGINLGSEL